MKSRLLGLRRGSLDVFQVHAVREVDDEDNRGDENGCVKADISDDYRGNTGRRRPGNIRD